MNPFAAIREGLAGLAAIPVEDPDLAARQERARQRRSAAPTDTRSLAGGRIVFDTPSDTLGAWRTVMAPQSADEQWRLYSLDTSTLDRMSPAQLMELLPDLSPEVSRALWDFLRMCNPGWECKAFRPGTETIDDGAQVALDAFWGLLKGYYGASDVQINRLFMSMFLRGAALSELVLDKAGRLPIDLAVIDPYVTGFRRKNDPDRGLVWQLCQMQNGVTVDLDRPTILYIPIDPMPGKPHGRALANPAIFTSVFGLAMLHDIRRVVQQQGWPRIDLEIQLEQLMRMLTEAEKDDPALMATAISTIVAEIKTIYAGLQPDDAYAHVDIVKVNRPVGTVDSSSLGAIDGLFKALERMAVRALKSNPLLMGLDMSASEGQANRMWETHAAGIKALQHFAESMLEQLLSLGLQAQGIVATVEFRFAELRVAELLRDAQVENLNSQIAKFQYQAGWISQDQAAQKGAGVAKANVSEPRTTSAVAPGNQVGGQPDPGSERTLADLTVRANGREVANGNGKH